LYDFVTLLVAGKYIVLFYSILLAWDRGAGHYFGFLLRRHLVLNVFSFLLNTAQLIGVSEKYVNWNKYISMLCLFFRVPYATPILLMLKFSLRCQVKCGKEKKIEKIFVFALQIRLHFAISVE
jgi:hypothetical protein